MRIIGFLRMPNGETEIQTVSKSGLKKNSGLTACLLNEIFLSTLNLDIKYPNSRCLSLSEHNFTLVTPFIAPERSPDLDFLSIDSYHGRHNVVDIHSQWRKGMGMAVHIEQVGPLADIAEVECVVGSYGGGVGIRDRGQRCMCRRWKCVGMLELLRGGDGNAEMVRRCEGQRKAEQCDEFGDTHFGSCDP